MANLSHYGSDNLVEIAILKDDLQKKESINIDRELALEKEAQQLKLNLYDGSVIGTSDVIVVPDSKNTLMYAEESSIIGKSDIIVVPDSENTIMHAEESRSKMIVKQNDLQLIEKKVITKPIDYATLNQLSIDFNTRFVPQTESYAEQAFWSQYSVQTDEPTNSGTTIVEVPKELPKVRMDTVILKLKEKIKSLRADEKESKVEDIETQNLELDHRVTKLTAENNHLKQTYKQLFDLIKSSRVQSKEQCDDLIN
nr:hypothetical protein [Tanacetum cinerariifolium]